MTESLFPEPADEPVCDLRPWTERTMLDLLARRYGQVHGNGYRYVGAEHVRNAAGFEHQRTADYVAMDLWPSSGLLLHGHEVKVSRSDWLTELKQPEKAGAFRPYMDRWWLVAPHGVVRDDLPDGWGLMVPVVDGLRVVKQAPRLESEPMPKTMLAAFLRAAVKTAQRQARAAA